MQYFNLVNLLKRSRSDLLRSTPRNLFFSTQSTSSISLLDLSDLIQIESKNNTYSHSSGNGICFYLDKPSIAKIEKAKTSGSKLYLTPDQLADLHSYCGLNNNHNLQWGLTFSTYYQGEAILCSLFFFHGEIINQIGQDYLEDGELLKTIITAHSWLIEQIIVQLKIAYRIDPDWLNWLSWLISCCVVITTVLINLDKFLSLNILLIFLAPLLMCWLLQLGIKRFLRKINSQFSILNS